MAAQICETCKKQDDSCYCAPNSTCEDYESKIMTQFEKFQSMDIDQLAEWIDENGQFDSSPWLTWWDKKYCSNCPSIMLRYKGSSLEFPVSWCEINGKCKFFPEMDETPGSKEIVKMWLESEIK